MKMSYRGKLTIKIVTLFPDFIACFAEAFGILKKATAAKLLDIAAIDLRAFGVGARKTVDGRPYGGGVGMVLRPDVLMRAVRKARGRAGNKATRVILLTPQGQKFNQAVATRLAQYRELVFVCGRYEGVDERIRGFVDEQLSIGDYVLMGGELPALVISEAVMRLRPGILGKFESVSQESFSGGLLEYPQYTKPEIWQPKKSATRTKRLAVPKILLSGDHARIKDWRNSQAQKRTKKLRPDLLS